LDLVKWGQRKKGKVLVQIKRLPLPCAEATLTKCAQRGGRWRVRRDIPHKQGVGWKEGAETAQSNTTSSRAQVGGKIDTNSTETNGVAFKEKN